MRIRTRIYHLYRSFVKHWNRFSRPLRILLLLSGIRLYDKDDILIHEESQNIHLAFIEKLIERGELR